MRLALTALALGMLAACDAGPRGASDAPAHIDRAGEVRLIVGERAQIQRACRRLGLSDDSVACFARSADSCTIWLTDPRQTGAREAGRSLDHELAHCGGWPPHHPL